MRIALDALGGDHGPGPNVAGAVLAVAAESGSDRRSRRRPSADRTTSRRRQPVPAGRLEIVHAADRRRHEGEAGRGTPPQAGRLRLPLLATCSPKGRWTGLVSAGNTGAVVAGGLQDPQVPQVRPPSRHRHRHAHRPKGRCVIIDVGANVFPKPHHLLEYGVMGSVFAQKMLGIERPTIGLMNVGEEEGKGHELVQKTYDLFSTSPLKDRFVGNIEGRDIHRGAADVVVTDGFTGNVVLKLSEGVFEFVMSMVNQEVIGALASEKEKARAAVKGLLGEVPLQRLRRCPAAGRGRRVHHLPRQFEGAGNRQRAAASRPRKSACASTTPSSGGTCCEAHCPTGRRESARGGSRIMSRTAFLFPGQGAQTVGMAGALCQSLPAAKALFDRAASDPWL